MTRLLTPLSALALLTVLAPAPPAASAAASASSGALVRLLHDGRFDEAESRLAGVARGPADPEQAFLHAFVVYWRLLYDDDNPALQAEFGRRLARATEIAEGAAAASPRNAEHALWAGMSRLMNGQLLAAQKKAMPAAMEAKRARAHLERAVALDPRLDDARFGLGTYNYLADQLPALAKGLRVLLAIPGGDRDAGLQQLDRAARHGERFGLEARLALVSLYSSRREKKMVAALRQVDLLLARQPRTIAALHAAARILVGVGHVRRAADLLDEALGRAGGAEPPVVANLRYLRARAELAALRPDLAEQWLEPIRPASIPLTLRDDIQAVRAEIVATRKAIEPGLWARVETAVGSADSARSDVQEARALLAARPDDPAVALVAARALVLAGRGAEALPVLSRAIASGRLPGAWMGPAQVLAGNAADLAGQRARALEWYRKALQAPAFVAKDAPHLYLARPYVARGA